MARLTLVLFRDGHDEGLDGLAAILGDIVRSRTHRYSLMDIDVQHRPGLAAHYHVRTTPTILLMKSGKVVDRVVGTPTRILLHNLLDARTARATTTTAGESRAATPTAEGQHGRRAEAS